MIYVDLLKNPERYTGYKGEASNRIWYMIYAENCFKYAFFRSPQIPMLSLFLVV